MSAFYNEIDGYAAAWLRNLIANGLIPDGIVDERSITDIDPAELDGYTQCHFFAGLGGWAHAARLAGWTAPLWTGSCPCQPFSGARKGSGFADERHLWPAWHHLIRVCQPPIVVGEQVASEAGLLWLDLVSADMEGEGYAFAPFDLCAAGVAAPQIRQRLFWVGCADAPGLSHTQPSVVPGQGRRQEGRAAKQPSRSFWADADWLPCRDSKNRPVEPGTFPLVNGAPARMGRLRAYGNAIVAPLAAEFLAALLEVCP